ncbi:Rieske 2Fe-2S domain-containing protein [Streptomyces chartreusis]|uniref:Rieske 2Fe-2S domain-containing protein n=1 Tax=Streptomyces chartreusis TaxID=1969 RepID=UPI0037F2E4D7
MTTSSSAQQDQETVTAPVAPLRRAGRPIPAEGAGGVFTQSWFPICQSTDVIPGKVFGTTFLDGRIVVFRGSDGVAQVLSAYCPHLGTDLGVGSVVDDTVVCALHRWQFDRSGACTRTGTGLRDAPPAAARLFRFPTVERWGLIWAFNGTEPLWELPDLQFPDDELVIHVGELGTMLDVDPWVFCCNTVDIQHLEALHGTEYDPQVLLGDEAFTATEFSTFIELKCARYGTAMHYKYGVWGTSFFTLEAEIGGRWYGVVDALAMPSPGKTRTYILGFAQKTGDDLADAAQAASAFCWERDVLIEDLPVFQNLHFRPGPPTKSDRSVVKFYEYLRKYPRAHPSADFIN